MRILHIDLGREMRGGQRQVLMLMKGLRTAGHSSELLARRGSPIWEAAKQSGFPVQCGGPRALWIHSNPAELVHVHDARSHSLAALVCRQVFVVSRRVAFPVGRRLASRWKYGRAKRFLAVSKFVASELEGAGIASRNIDVVYDAVEPISEPRVQPIGVSEVVALDSRDPDKGRDLVEQAAAIAKVRVVFSSDLAKDLQQASVFLYITRSEGFGSAALLAMSLQVPVIASRVGGLPEVVEEGQSGLLVENDPNKIAAALLELTSNQEAARTLGRNGRLRVERTFTVGHMVAGTLESYKRALAG